MKRLSYLVLIFLSLAFLVYACGTSEAGLEEPESGEPGELDREPFTLFDISDDLAEAYLEEMDLENMSEEEFMFYRTRSNLNDLFNTQFQDIPDVFLQEVEEEEVDIYQGFRVQIQTTRDVQEADSTLEEFEAWADRTIAEFMPRGYVHFRQPYYRVRVGDFHNRERAIEFSRMIKFRYPDAWLIHDRINPYRVPADTVEFRFVDITERIQTIE